jgi:uncharacterized metal-binding protein YceD (DUF177 family)
MGQNDDMTIRFSGLKSGNYNYHFTLNEEFFEEWKNEEIEGGKVEIEVKMERLERMLMFTFSLSGEIATPCDRCLGRVMVPIAGEEHLCVRFSDTETCENEDVVVLPENAFEIDLTQWLYEYVAVRIPMQHIHPDGECDPEVTRYIQVESDERKEESDEVDPRWEALKGLRSEE